MIELTVSVILQGVILGAFLLIICILIGWFKDITGYSFRQVSSRLRTLDTRILLNSCYHMSLYIHDTVGGRRILGFQIAVFSAACYVAATYMAFHKDLDFLQGVVAGWFLSILAVAVAYDWQNPPTVLTSHVVSSLGVACLLFALIAMSYKHYYCFCAVGLAGVYTIVVGGFLYIMNALKSTEGEDESNEA